MVVGEGQDKGAVSRWTHVHVIAPENVVSGADVEVPTTT